jgi:hypothetical protein
MHNYDWRLGESARLAGAKEARSSIAQACYYHALYRAETPRWTASAMVAERWVESWHVR